jgi:transcription-repair coupling factor (superfamily II helicase)
LSKDIKIPKLGLLVIDEEQRFGVKHKESIKQLKAAVDVLTLSATPIPRTLELSLTGIRDLTLLHTPPADRQPILTYVGEYDERAVAEAIRRELLREGQAFFVHNRVQDIEQVADELRSLVPEARVAVAHGQMDEGSLEQVVYDFWEQEYDVLVCTTIIESGIDMPSVNTLVVDRADLLGLGQMHQLRGRVGRSGQRAYAYLFHPADKVLSEDAYERLKTVGEATELGSGFRIAMRDLEIRGAGNLVGTGQTGHIAAVGYDLYCQLVTEAVAVLKGETVEVSPDVKIEIPTPANLPESYAPKEAMRLMAYRRLSNVTTLAEVADVAAEWEDRFGPIPPPAQMLLAIAKLRVLALEAEIEEIVAVKGPGFGGPKAVARIRPVKLAASKELRLSRLYPKSKYDPDIGLLQLAVSSRSEAVPETIAALTDLEIFPAEASLAEAETASS